MADDFKAGTSTTGTVAVGGSATGDIERKGDIDWFAVELVAGRTYVIDLEGAGAGTGTLGDTMLWGLFDAAGGRVAKRSRDGGEGNDARMTFTATESGTFYIAARGQRKDDTGTYTVRVRDQDAATQTPSVNTNTPQVLEQTSGQQQAPQPPADPDATAAGAADLGDLATLGRAVRKDSVDGGDDVTDYYSFSLGERQTVTLSLRGQDADADLYLEDGAGTVLASSRMVGTRNESIERTLEAGTYYVRVAADEAGRNDYALRAKAADPAVVKGPGSQPQLRPEPGRSEQNAPINVNRPAVDTDATRAGATYLGDFGRSKGRGTVEDSVDGTADGTDYYSFKIHGHKAVAFTLKDLDADADLYLEDDKGNVLASSTNDGTKNEQIDVSLPQTLDWWDASEAYYLRVVAKEAGANAYTLDYSSSWAKTNWTQVHQFLDQFIQREPDGGLDFAQDTSTRAAVAASSSAKGIIYHSGDVDWFRVELEAGKTYRFDVKGQTQGLSGLYDENGASVGLKSGHGKFAFFTPTENGTFYAAVAGDPWRREEDRTGSYTLSVAEAEDDFTADTDTTGTVAVGGSTWGEVEYWDDRDWLKVELEAGTTYRIELHGSRKLNGWSHDVPSGNVDPEAARQTGERATLWDYHMRGAVYDAEGNRVGDDALGWGGLDGRWHRPPGCKEGWLNRVEFTPTESGAYYVEVDTGHYRYIATVDVGGPAPLSWKDDDTVPAPADAVGTYKVSVAVSDFVATEEYTL
ncbi:MAG: hypothetical protein F4213_11245 [Boseongicola sp. SB0677_bin_26]|nr:hypothetical protein [Boseongicola sp. SB0677_bin_26]